MFGIIILLSVSSLRVYGQNGKLLNVDLFSNYAVNDDYSGEETIIGYTKHKIKPLNFTFGRTNHPEQIISTEIALNGDVDTSSNFPTGTITVTGEDGNGAFLSVSIPGGINAKEKFGSFSFHVSNEEGSGKTGIVLSSSSSGSIVSVKRTVSSGIGDRVTLQMITERSSFGLRWRHNYGDIITKWNGLINVTIETVRLKDGGVYECYHEEDGIDGKHGVTRLIVRECPSSRWNPPVCDMSCPVCYNGGICDDVTGACICLPGFKGQNCENVCAPDTFGRDCLSTCLSSTEGCKGALVCPSDPVGCSCTNGYGGKNCTESCPAGWYGAECSQICNCDQSSCHIHYGCIGNCLPNYTGPQCQELMSHISCPVGFYGTLCDLRCHCKYSESCERNGNCAGICESGWDGDDCSIALAVLSKPPRVVSRTSSSVTIDFTWSAIEDYGAGDVQQIKGLWYNSSSGVTVKNMYVSTNEYTIGNLQADSLVSFYVQHIQVINGGHSVHGPNSPMGTALTTCSEPRDAPSLQEVTRVANGIRITIEGVQETIEGIRCDEIVRYEVRFRSANGAEEIIHVDYNFNKEILIKDLSECLSYEIDARVVNNEDFKGPWSNMLEAEGHLPGLNISNWSYTNDGSIRVSWQPVKCSGQNFDQRMINFFYQVLGSDVSGQTQGEEVVLDADLNPCTYYTLTIYASFAGLSGESDSISFITKPPAPRNIQELSVKDKSFTVHWESISCSQSLDISYVWTLNQASVDLELTQGSTKETSLTFNQRILPCTEYSLTISTFSSGVSGPSTTYLVLTTPSAPQVDVIEVTASSIYVSWLNPSGVCKVTNYHVVLSNVDEDDIVADEMTSEMSILFDEKDGVSTDTIYTLKVAARNRNGYGPYSNYTVTIYIPTSSTFVPEINTTTNKADTEDQILIGGDIIAIVVGSALVLIIITSCIRIARSRIQNKDTGPVEVVDLNQRSYSKDEYSTNSTTHDTFTENNSSSYN